MYCHGHNNMKADGGKGEEDKLHEDTPSPPLFTVTRSKLNASLGGVALHAGWYSEENTHVYKIDEAYLRNSCRQVSQKRWPQVDTWTGSRIALLQSGHWKRLLGFSRNL